MIVSIEATDNRTRLPWRIVFADGAYTYDGDTFEIQGQSPRETLDGRPVDTLEAVPDICELEHVTFRESGKVTEYWRRGLLVERDYGLPPVVQSERIALLRNGD